MTRKEQVKILDDKIKANNAQYDLDRMNAEISAYSSGDLPKYEYLTKKDLGYKPDALKKDISYKDIKQIKNNINLAVKYYPDENKSIINNSNKVIKAIDLIILLIDNDNLRITKQYYAKPLNNTNLSWIKNKDEYKHIADEAGSDYLKRNNDKELKIIKDFITKTNNGKINESNAASEFKQLKQKVNNDKLKYDLVKYLEKSLFGEDIESIKPEEKYEESIAERVKKQKRQDTQKTFAPSSPPKKDYSEETANVLKYMKEEKKDQKRFSDDYDGNGWSSGSALKMLTNKQMLNCLPILLAQIQAGNNSIKLKNEIRQILYSLCRSKVLTKTVYNNLIKSIR